MAHGRRAGRKIDRVRWEGDQLITVLGQAATSNGIELLQLGEPLAAATVMRTRGQIAVWFDATPAAGDAVHVAIGMHVVPKGTDTSITSSPIGEAEAAWFVYATAVLAFEGTGATEGMSWYRFEIDSKAMRKMGPGEEIQLVVQSATLGTAQAVNWAGQVRFLLGT